MSFEKFAENIETIVLAHIDMVLNPTDNAKIQQEWNSCKYKFIYECAVIMQHNNLTLDEIDGSHRVIIRNKFDEMVGRVQNNKTFIHETQPNQCTTPPISKRYIILNYAFDLCMAIKCGLMARKISIEDNKLDSTENKALYSASNNACLFMWNLHDGTTATLSIARISNGAVFDYIVSQEYVVESAHVLTTVNAIIGAIIASMKPEFVKPDPPPVESPNLTMWTTAVNRAAQTPHGMFGNGFMNMNNDNQPQFADMFGNKDKY